MSTPGFADSAADMLRWAEALSGIARTGLGFTQSLYERERFEEVLKVAADIRAAAIEEAEADVLFDEWLSTVGEGVAGYVTPQGRGWLRSWGTNRGEILLTPARRFRMVVVPGRLGRRGLLRVGDRDEGSARGDRHRVRTGFAHRGSRRFAPRFRRVPMYSLVFHCRMTGGELKGHPLETSAVGFFARDALPQPLAGAHRWLDLAFRAARRRDGRDVVRPAPATPRGAANRSDSGADRMGGAARSDQS